jgi:uncharacterized repeat protein (TIGR03803 family)
MLKLRVSSGVALLSMLLAAWPLKAQTYSVLYNFAGGADGSLPSAALVRDAAGNLYGTTYLGGNMSCYGPNGLGCGTVFKLDASGRKTTLHTFAGPDGAAPNGALYRDSGGNLYGTTVAGGDPGYGAAFKIDSAGNESVLHSFTGPDGANPSGALVPDGAGNFYGATAGGGASGFGVVFKMDAGGNVTVLYNFAGNPTDGAGPLGTLVLDHAGNLYGTTQGGGSSFNGVVFKLDAAGNETLLHDFTGGADGGQPWAGLIRDTKGNLYGTAEVGGTGCGSYGCGLVFMLSPGGEETVLLRFHGYPTDGQDPFGALVQDASGNVYGTTFSGGTELRCRPIPAPCGTIFKLSGTGEETLLHNFAPHSGIYPYAGLIPDPAGNLYGVASEGGDTSRCGGAGCGVVFKLSLQ